MAEALFKLLLLCWFSEQLSLCMGPFKNRVLVSYSLPTVPELSPIDFQSWTLWALLQVHVPRAESEALSVVSLPL